MAKIGKRRGGNGSAGDYFGADDPGGVGESGCQLAG